MELVCKSKASSATLASARMAGVHRMLRSHVTLTLMSVLRCDRIAPTTRKFNATIRPAHSFVVHVLPAIPAMDTLASMLMNAKSIMEDVAHRQELSVSIRGYGNLYFSLLIT